MPNNLSRAVGRNFVPAAICTLGLVIGFGSAVTLFASIDAALRGAFPYGNPERLFVVDFIRPTGSSHRVSMEQLEVLREGLTTASRVGAFWDSSQVVLDGEYAGPIQAVYLEPELLRLLDVSPLLGRLPSPSGDNECVMGEDLWISRLNGNREVLGTFLALTESRCTLVGVMPSSFFFPDPRSDLWLPLPQAAQLPAVKSQPNLLVTARLPSEADRIALFTQLQALPLPAANNLRPRIRSLPEVVTQDYRQALTSLLAAILAVVILSTINLASFIKAICVDRRRELAIRLALGANRFAIAMMVIRFGMTIAAPSAVGGLLLALLLLRALKSMDLPDLWWLQSVAITWETVGILVATTTLVAIIAAASAFPYVIRMNAVGELIRPIGAYETFRRRRIIWSVAGQVASATAIAAFASVCVQSYVGALRASWGFDPANLIIVETEYPPEAGSREARTLFIESALRNLRSSNALDVVAAGQGVPLRWKGWEIAKARSAGAEIDVGLWKVSSDYFKALRVPVIAGREFTEAAPTNGSVILSAAAANQLCRHQCVGQQIEILTGTASVAPTNMGDRIRWVPYASLPWEIVGIVENYKAFGLEVESRPAIFLHHTVQPKTSGVRLRPTFLLRGREKGEAYARASIVDAFGSGNTQTKVVEIVSMDRLINEALGIFGSRKLLAVAGSVISGLAVFVAISGIFAVSSSVAVQRIREIAIRLAIGGTPANVFASVAGSILRSALLGLGFGVIASVAAVTYAESLLFGSAGSKLAAGSAVLVLVSICTLMFIVIAFVAPTRRRTLIRVLNE